MSQILDALKKADEQRKLGQPPKLDSVDFSSLVKSRKNNKKLGMSLLTLLIVTLFMLVGYYVFNYTNLLNAKSGKYSELNPEIVDTNVKNKNENLSNSSHDYNKNILNDSASSGKAPLSENTKPKEGIEVKTYDNKVTKSLPESSSLPDDLYELTDIQIETISDTVPPDDNINIDIPAIAAVDSKSIVKNPGQSTSKSIELPDNKYTPIPAWKKNITISAIVYDINSNDRFVLIKGTKLKEGSSIPDTDYSVSRILEKSIMIKSSKGDELVINVY